MQDTKGNLFAAFLVGILRMRKLIAKNIELVPVSTLDMVP